MNTSSVLRLMLLAFGILIGHLLFSQTISIQSTVKDQNGKAVENDDVTMTFKLYNVASGGLALWNETDTVAVEGGVYSHQLGSNTTLPASIFGSQLYLGVTIAGGQELIPRTMLSYAPYSLATTAIADNDQSASFEGSGQLKITQDAIVIDQLGVKVPALTNITSSVDLAIGDNNTGLNQSAEDVLQLVTNGSPRMVIHANGKISTGANPTNAPTSKVNFSLGDGDNGLGISGDTIHLVSNDNLNITSLNSKVFVSPQAGFKISNTSLADLAIGDNDTGLNQNGDGVLQVVTNNAARITVLGNGRVGIGTSTPAATLDVFPSTENVGDPQSGTGIYFNDVTPSLSSSSNLNFLNNVAISANGEIVAADHIVCFATINWSDERMKTIIAKSNSQEDLEIIKKIEITEYKYIDSLQKGNSVYKKLIAQQVESVYPEAITHNYNVVPNVYQKAKSFQYDNGLLTICTSKKHEFAIGDLIDLITPKTKLNRIEVSSVINEFTFTVEVKELPEEVFVYGKWIKDFKGVDYEAIAMLNVSATQELIKKIENLEKTVEDLYHKNNTLKSENESMKKDSIGMENRLSKIETALSDYLNKKDLTVSVK